MKTNSPLWVTLYCVTSPAPNVEMARRSEQDLARIYIGERDLVGVSAKTVGIGLVSSASGIVPDNLKEVFVPVIDNATCDAFYQDPVTARMMCAGATDTGAGVCSGDSGGPLYGVVGIRQVLIGITSFGVLIHKLDLSGKKIGA